MQERSGVGATARTTKELANFMREATGDVEPNKFAVVGRNAWAAMVWHHFKHNRGACDEHVGHGDF